MSPHSATYSLYSLLSPLPLPPAIKTGRFFYTQYINMERKWEKGMVIPQGWEAIVKYEGWYKKNVPEPYGVYIEDSGKQLEHYVFGKTGKTYMSHHEIKNDGVAVFYPFTDMQDIRPAFAIPVKRDAQVVSVSVCVGLEARIMRLLQNATALPGSILCIFNCAYEIVQEVRT